MRHSKPRSDLTPGGWMSEPQVRPGPRSSAGSSACSVLGGDLRASARSRLSVVRACDHRRLVLAARGTRVVRAVAKGPASSSECCSCQGLIACVREWSYGALSQPLALTIAVMSPGVKRSTVASSASPDEGSLVDDTPCVRAMRLLMDRRTSSACPVRTRM